jgi:hypothetical protein
MNSTSNTSDGIDRHRGRRIARVILTVFVIILFLADLAVLFWAAQLRDFVSIIVSECRVGLIVMNAVIIAYVGYFGFCRTKKPPFLVLGAFAVFALAEICIIIYGIREGWFFEAGGIR